MAKAHVRPRPIRVAFLVEESEHWSAILQAIFAESYGRWGGRFSLIVPCENQEIRPSYLNWLQTYDPDIIYSYVDFSDATVERFHELFYPAFLVKHHFYGPERSGHAFRPRLPVEPLSSLSVALTASRGRVISGSQPIGLIDINLSTKPSDFLQDNFGCYGLSSNVWPLSADMLPYIHMLTVVPPEIAADGRLVPRAVGETVASELELLEQLAKPRTLSGLAQMSAQSTPRLELRAPGWSGSATIVIGDSFIDRITFWNARSHVPAWLDDSLVTLRLSVDDLEDQKIFQAILGLIQWRLRAGDNVNSDGIILRSASLSASDLESIQNRFREKDKWKRYSCKPIATIDECVPDDVVLKQAHFTEGNLFFRSGDWHEISFSEDVFRPPTIAPRHIREVAPLPSGVKGAWAIDFDIERKVDYSRFENIHHHWRLPRRLRMTSAFTRGYPLDGRHGPTCIPRVTSPGLITLFAVPGGFLPELSLPSDETAFRAALLAPRDWLPFDHKRGPLQNSLMYDARPSDKGRYLTALLRLADGIHRAREIFLQKFWNEQFKLLGATSAFDDERLPDLVNKLKKRLRNGTLSNEDEWLRVARAVRTEAKNLRLARRYLRFDRLQEDFDQFRDTYWKLHRAVTDRSEWDDDEKKSLAESVQYLCERQILHQGHEWLCSQCNNGNWVSIADLRPKMICEVCGAEKSAPIAEAWRFKLNAFVLEGLRDHGLLASLWCLMRLSEKAQSSFFFLEPQELFLTPNSVDRNSPDSELDLLVVVDGQVVLCEIKTSNQKIDIEKFAELAKRLRPDIAILAVMEMKSRNLEDKLTKLKASLPGDIEIELMTLESDDFDESPMLPNGRTYWHRAF